MLEEYIKQLTPKINGLFKKDYRGHDIAHLERTMKAALHIQKIEGGDEIIIGISAFLHDIHRIIQKEKGKYVSPKDSLKKVKEILSSINLNEEQANKILYCIEHHEDYNWNNPENIENDINTLILQDADNLDAIGAIGIGRTFLYDAKRSVPMYDANIPLEFAEEYQEQKDDETTIHHFYHKSLRLGNNMNTETGKQLAKSRIDFMKNFVEEFLDEWDGKR